MDRNIQYSLESALIVDPKSAIEYKRNEILEHQAKSNDKLFRLMKELDELLKDK